MTNEEVVHALKADGVDVSTMPADKLAKLGHASLDELKAIASLLKKTSPGRVPLDGGIIF